jgi:tetratricopeptide (TPR) repeat protein
MKLSKIAVLLASAALMNVSAFAGPPKFKTDASVLSVQKREQFSDVESLLNDWTGENEKLVAASVKIDSLIKSDPDFLPIYIEKARLSIMLGASGTNDFAKANRDALKILSDVQKKDGTYAKSYVLAGHAFLNIGDFENAKKALEHAERIGTTDPWLYNNWADLLGRLEQYDRALAYARKALLLSKDAKAMSHAISLISDYAKYAEQPTNGADVTSVVFQSFKEPDERMRIASRLIESYDGDASILGSAYRMIERQSKETPHLESADLAMAEWLLKKGYLKTVNCCRALYDSQYSAAAEQILDTIPPSTTANARIFASKFAIALSNFDLNQAGALLKNAEAAGVPHPLLMEKQAMLMWLMGDYANVISIFEELGKTDPTFLDSSLLMHAYAHLGRTDMQKAYYKRQIDRDPTSAWNLGNYAGFLLYTMHDLDGAIQYGDAALKQMEYPIAQSTTSLAYLMKAATLKRDGNNPSAKKHVDRARSIGFDEGFVAARCESYCADIQSLLRRP